MDSKKLIKIIRTIVKEEVKSAVNEILAEQFIRTLSENKSSKPKLESVINLQQEKNDESKQLQEQQRQELRKKLLNKISGGNPVMMEAIEDVSPLNGMNGIPMDGEDEGVDISIFGLKG